jgi:predicted O-linked N-acetylglucosamine transferase (SPINDLY family)
LPALANGYLTFGSLNNIAKVDTQSIDIWARLLHALPTARMLILAVPEARSYFIDRFATAGIDAARLDFLGNLTPREYREAIQRIDVSLDSYPFNGATTTCESLWQGVPTLSLYGDRFLSRNGLSIMAAARLPDFAAATPEGLINTAVLLANNPGILQNIRLGMREHLANTPLLDQRQFVLNLESIYRSIWIEWCNSPA